MSYVECRRTLLSESDRRFGGARLFRGQHARGGARRKVRLWCGISQRPRRALSDDHRAHHHAERPVYASVGRWLSEVLDRKSTRLNSSHGYISYAVFCLKKKKTHLR